ncbi:MAG: hypothetical protein ACPLZG_12055, partial [Thermoproteota archaeon]
DFTHTTLQAKVIGEKREQKMRKAKLRQKANLTNKLVVYLTLNEVERLKQIMVDYNWNLDQAVHMIFLNGLEFLEKRAIKNAILELKK